MGCMLLDREAAGKNGTLQWYPTEHKVMSEESKDADVLNMASFRSQKSLGQAQIGLL